MVSAPCEWWWRRRLHARAFHCSRRPSDWQPGACTEAVTRLYRESCANRFAALDVAVEWIALSFATHATQNTSMNPFVLRTPSENFQTGQAHSRFT